MDEFEEIVEKIREKLKIKDYDLTNFLGHKDDFGMGDKYDYLLPQSIDTFEIAFINGNVMFDKGEEDNWKNLSLLKTIYDSSHYEESDDTWLTPMLYLESQGIPVSVGPNGVPIFPYYPKNDFVSISDLEGGFMGDEENAYWLFVPELDQSGGSALWEKQGIYFPHQYFAIIKLYRDPHSLKIIYDAWWFKTPETPSRFDNTFFPFYQTDWVQSFAQESSIWNNGRGWSVDGGGFYLGENAEILLDLSPSVVPQTLGLLNWWGYLDE